MYAQINRIFLKLVHKFVFAEGSHWCIIAGAGVKHENSSNDVLAAIFLRVTSARIRG